MHVCQPKVVLRRLCAQTPVAFTPPQCIIETLLYVYFWFWLSYVVIAILIIVMMMIIIIIIIIIDTRKQWRI